jgi:hypothetical protein
MQYISQEQAAQETSEYETDEEAGAEAPVLPGADFDDDDTDYKEVIRVSRRLRGRPRNHSYWRFGVADT